MKNDEKIEFEMIPATLRAVFSEQIKEDEDEEALKNQERKSKKQKYRQGVTWGGEKV